MTLALVLGTLLAIGALAFVLYPLFVAPREDRVAPSTPAAPGMAASDSAVDALREIELDRATGKLSDADYAALKSRYTREAVAAMRAAGGETAPPPPSLGSGPTSEKAAPVPDDAVEAAIRRQRAALRECIDCGPRPEPDAIFCSSCGRYLSPLCRRCGAAVTRADARYCDHCGERLVA